MATTSPPPNFLNPTTILSLLATLVILLTAYLTSLRLLPSTTRPILRVFFIWHLFDALIHFTLEGSFLYNCFFTYSAVPLPTPDSIHPASLPTAAVHFLGRADRAYGSAHGTNPFALLWQEYARADKRWGEADLTVISLELLTVFGAGPLAVYVCKLISEGAGREGGGRGTGKLWFWGSVLATGELYGG